MKAREIALRIINEINIKGSYANIALAQEINRRNLSNQDRRFMTELVYGTIKSGATLDWILTHFITRKLDTLPPVILDILRLGAYQLFFLTAVPDSAACNESVELAKKYGHAGTVRFVNGVLRGAARNKSKVIYPDKQQLPDLYLSLVYFHPLWLIRRWLQCMDFAECEQLCQANNSTPLLAMRTNTLKISREELLIQLQQEGVTCEPSLWTPEGIVCSEYPAIGSLASLKQGLYQIQDESSMLVSHVLAPQPGELVIDACAAPGGKSTHIASLMNNKGRVISIDIYPHKLSLIEQSAQRLGLTCIETKLLDARQLEKHFLQQADRVLVDAPCSGLGVLRRKADSRWRKNEEMLCELPKLQLDILKSASECVKPGGILVYSTCTTEKEENANIITAFLQERDEYILENAGDYVPGKKQDTLVQLWPHRDNVDGFFIARLRRIK